MTNKKTLGIAALIALFVTIIGGFVVYAALTQRLDIQGSADFVPESWKVNFKDGTLSTPVLTGDATVTTAPTLADTIISNFEVVLVREGSSVTYTFDIENTGSLDAKLTSYVLGTPVCTGTAGTTKTADEGIVCSSNLTYSLKYITNSNNATNGITAGNNVATNDMLKHGTNASVELKISFSSAATQLPANAVAISGLNSYLIYTAQ